MTEIPKPVLPHSDPLLGKAYHWIISLFTTHLKSHVQYTWSSFLFPSPPSLYISSKNKKTSPKIRTKRRHEKNEDWEPHQFVCQELPLHDSIWGLNGHIIWSYGLEIYILSHILAIFKVYGQPKIKVQNHSYWIVGQKWWKNAKKNGTLSRDLLNFLFRYGIF